MRSIVSILPTLVGLMVGVGVLRSSGFLDKLGEILGTWMQPLGFPPELVPLGVVRLFPTAPQPGCCWICIRSMEPIRRSVLPRH